MSKVKEAAVKPEAKPPVDPHRHAAWLQYAPLIGSALRERVDGDAPTEADTDEFVTAGPRANKRAASISQRLR